MENTAAGLSGILTRFPFNSDRETGNLKHGKCNISFSVFKYFLTGFPFSNVLFNPKKQEAMP